MPTLNELTALRTRVERFQREADKASGALEQAMKRLKDDFGCASLKEAEAKLKQLQKDEQKTEASFDRALEQFEEDWPEEE